MLCKVLLTFESAEPLARFFGIGFMLYKVLLTFESAEPLVRFFGIVFMLYKVLLTFESAEPLARISSDFTRLFCSVLVVYVRSNLR